MKPRIEPTPDGHGTLNWMVWWQSIDGRMEIEYFQVEQAAFNKVTYLECLGRSPQIYRRYQVALLAARKGRKGRKG